MTEIKTEAERVEWQPDYVSLHKRARDRCMKDMTGTDFYEHLVRVAYEDGKVAALSIQDELVEALEPFATFAENNVDEEGWGGLQCQRERIVDWFGPTDFRRARSLLTRIKSESGGSYD